MKFNGIDILDEFARELLAKFMDLSNFGINHASYDVANKDKLELFKSEAGSLLIKEFICLQPKCYSVLLDNDSCKSTVKGVNRSIKLQ